MKKTSFKRKTAVYQVAIFVVSLMLSSAIIIPMNLSEAAAINYESIAEKRAQMLNERISDRNTESTEAASTPSKSSKDGDVTTQDILANPRALQSTNLLNTKAIYEISFQAKTDGTIHEIELEFPAGTNIVGGSLIERVGIGPGVFLKQGNSLVYQVSNPVNVPEGTFIRLEIGNILNPLTVNSPLTVTVTTRSALDTVIDGPTTTNAYFMRNINTAELANGAVTANKVSPSFMVSRILQDGQNGWDPNLVLFPTRFFVGDPAVHASNSHVYISVDEPADAPGENVVCMVEDIIDAQFEVVCDVPPAQGSKLRYTVINQP